MAEACQTGQAAQGAGRAARPGRRGRRNGLTLKRAAAVRAVRVTINREAVMEVEYWIVAIVAAAVALVAGFIGGRMSSASQRQVEAMARERDEAREQAEKVRAEVNQHFEESARMFGKLASDYRTFFEQFAHTAQKLGLSEGRARELLQQADPNLVSDEQAASAADAAGSAAGGASAAEPASADAGPETDAAAHAPGSSGEAETPADDSADTARDAAAPATGTSGAAETPADDGADTASAASGTAPAGGGEGEPDDTARRA